MYRGGPLVNPAAADLNVDGVQRLRQTTVDDAEALFNLVESNRAHLREWLPWLDGVKSVADERRAIEFFNRERESGRGAFWVIEKLQSVDAYKPVGMVGINWVDQHNGGCLLGYWVAQNEAGQGTITTSMRRVVNYCFQELQIHRVAIEVVTGNKRGRNVAERLGFWLEGIQKDKQWQYDHFEDIALYAMTAPEWRR
eukprot:Lankesteria_metandrocarpae@DN3489_c0_g1_i1.p1